MAPIKCKECEKEISFDANDEEEEVLERHYNVVSK